MRREREVARKLAKHQAVLLLEGARGFVGDRRARRNAPLRPTHLMSIAEATEHIQVHVGNYKTGTALDQVTSWVYPTPPYSPEATTVAKKVAADSALTSVVYALVRALQPSIVVETGVATGATSAHVLAALADNGVGHLHSIDLPPLSLMMSGLVGAAVPMDLRDRWTYHAGPARRLLPSILLGLRGGMDLFIHDSDHRYPNMRWELREAWRDLAPGGWLVVDDVHRNTAFSEQSASACVQPMYVAQRGDTWKGGYIGLLQKSLE